MTQNDPPEFEPDDVPALGSRRGSAPGVESDPEPDGDLVRCSRFLDNDLDVPAKDAFEADLAVRGDLRQLLAELRAATDWVRSPIEPSDAELDHVMASVWARLDEPAAAEEVSTLPSLSSDRAAAVLAHPTRRPRPGERRQRTWAPLLQWSAAAAVVVAIALVAVIGGSGDDSTSGDDESASVALEQQRSVDATLDQGVSSGVQDALTATSQTTTGNIEAELGTFSDLAGLLDRLRTVPAAPTPVPGAADASGETTGRSSQETSPAASPPPCDAEPPEPTSRLVRSGLAVVADARVLWTLWESAGRQRIIVRDASTCAVLADQAV